MKHDPIVEEIHQIRERALGDYDGDLEKWMNHLKVAEKEDQRCIVNTETLQEKKLMSIQAKLELNMI